MNTPLRRGIFLGVLCVTLAACHASAQSDVRMPSEFEASGSQLETLFTFFGGVATSSASLDGATIFSGGSCRLNIGFQTDANFTRAGAGFGALEITPPNLAVPSGADTFSVTIQSPTEGTLSFKVTAREDDDGNGLIEPEEADDQWETEDVFLLPGTHVYNIPLAAFTNAGSGNDVQDLSTTARMGWFLTFETDASYPGGMVTVPVSFLIDHAGFYVGAQSIPEDPPPVRSVVHERWQSSLLGPIASGEFVSGDEGPWAFIAATPTGSSAETIWHNASRALRVSTGSSAAASLTRAPLAVALESSTTISFSAWSELSGAAPGDRVAIRLTDTRGNQLSYVIDRPANDTPIITGTSAEVFLEPGVGRYERQLLADFQSIAGFSAAGAAVSSVEFRVQAVMSSGVLDDLKVSTDTILGNGRGAVLRSSGESNGRTTVTYTSSTGRPVLLQRSPEGQWTSEALDETMPGVPGGVGARASGTWVDPGNGRSFASVASASGLFVIDTGVSPAGVRNLTDELGPTHSGITPITGPSTVFTSVDGFVNIVGLDASGDFVRYFQTGASTDGDPGWGFMNISGTQLAPNGITTPAIVSDLVPYVANWGGLHVAGLDADGDIHAVWWAPGAPHWFANNLSLERGTPALDPDAGLSAYVTPWGGLNLTGLDAGGSVVVLWWAPQLGEGNWQNTNLTSAYAGPTLADVGLASFVTPWGALNVCGVTPGGDLVNYWWLPGFDSWLVTSISGASADQGPPRLTDGLSGLGSPSGTISIFGTTDNGDAVRYLWTPSDGPQWHHETVREASQRR